MYWHDKKQHNPNEISADVIDLSFRLECRELPIDHAWSLAQALLHKLPWIEQTQHTAVHQIHIPAAANGWQRDDSRQGLMQLSKRCRWRLRLAQDNINDARILSGQTVEIQGHRLTFGAATPCLLAHHTTLLSRYVVDHAAAGEHSFIESVVQRLSQRGIVVHKLLCGREHNFSTPHGPIKTRSVMLAELDPDDSIRLQRQGLEPGRLMGFGIFIPHKGIEAVSSQQQSNPVS